MGENNKYWRAFLEWLKQEHGYCCKPTTIYGIDNAMLFFVCAVPAVIFGIVGIDAGLTWLLS